MPPMKARGPQAMQQQAAPAPIEQALDEIQNRTPPAQAVPAPAVETAEWSLEQSQPVESDVGSAAMMMDDNAMEAGTEMPAPEDRMVQAQHHSSFLGLSIGLYDPDNRNESVSFNVEWQPGVRIMGAVQPLFGALATTDSGMLGYAGVGLPLHLGSFFAMPSLAVGAYKEGAGRDLDSTLAWRAGTELAYEFSDKSRLGINAHILTNGESTDRRDRIGILSLVYTTPTDFLSGGR